MLLNLQFSLNGVIQLTSNIGLKQLGTFYIKLIKIQFIIFSDEVIL